MLRQLNPFYITVTYSVRPEVLTEVTMKVTVFWDVMPCGLVDHSSVLPMLRPGLNQWKKGEQCHQ
jgi:hypothetical protein